jgi:hypothetical protein
VGSGFESLTPHLGKHSVHVISVERFVERFVIHAVYSAVMTRAAKGHVEQLPSGSFRVSVYAGVDPLTRQQIRLRSTAKDERLA